MSVEPATEPLTPPERELVDRARAGDRDAIGGIYDLYLTAVYRYVLARVNGPNEAEDITEEVFLKVIEYIGRFEWQENVPFSAWLYRIAKNQIISHHRKHGGRPQNVSTDDIDVEDAQPGPESLVEQKMTTREVFEACEHLSKPQREIIAMRFGAGMSVKETAEALGKSENNVKVQQHKAIAKLQKLLRVK